MRITPSRLNAGRPSITRRPFLMMLRDQAPPLAHPVACAHCPGTGSGTQGELAFGGIGRPASLPLVRYPFGIGAMASESVPFSSSYTRCRYHWTS